MADRWSNICHDVHGTWSISVKKIGEQFTAMGTEQFTAMSSSLFIV
jgi:hypothetical protein